MSWDVAVIGGGAIGLAVARELAVDHAVLLLERGLPGQQASWAAAGMLCPHGEAARDDPFFRLSLSSLRMYRSFVLGLREETGVDAAYVDAGTLVLADTPQDWEKLVARCRWQQAAGLESTLMTPEDVRSREPRLTLDIRGGLFCPTDHQVEPRFLLEALRKACAIRGVDVRSGTTADEIEWRNGRVCAVRSGSTRFSVPCVVVAAGAWSTRIRGLAPLVTVRPRKGQILALEMPAPAFHHVIRWRQFYFVPKRNGRLVVGATNEDCGYDRSLTASGIRQLLDAATQMASAVAQFRIVETWSGLRPETPDGLPVIGAKAGGLIYAFGHYRNGILLTPVTAEIIGNTVRERATNDSWTAFAPSRFEFSETTSDPRTIASRHERAAGDV